MNCGKLYGMVSDPIIPVEWSSGVWSCANPASEARAATADSLRLSPDVILDLGRLPPLRDFLGWVLLAGQGA